MAKILVYGAGAVGQLVGGLIARAKRHSVYMIGRYDHYDKISSGGIILQRGTKSEHIRNLDFMPSTGRLETKKEIFDWLFLTVKSYSIPDALNDLKSVIHDNMRILLFQMGVGSHEMVLKAFPEERVFLAALTANVGVIQPGNIIQTNLQGGLSIAPLKIKNSTKELMYILSTIDIPVVEFEDYRPMKWSSLLYDVLLNGQCAIVDYTPEKIMEMHDNFVIEMEAFAECLEIIKKMNVKIVDLPGYPVKKISMISKLPDFIRYPILKKVLLDKNLGKSSILKIDMDKAKRDTEIVYINGAIEKKGREVHINTPVNDFTTDELVKIVKGKQQWGIYRKAPQKFREILKLFKVNYLVRGGGA